MQHLKVSEDAHKVTYPVANTATIPSPSPSHSAPLLPNTRHQTLGLVLAITIGSLVSGNGCLAAGDMGVAAGPVFELEVVVARLTAEHSRIDKGARRLHAALKDQFRYEGIRVLEMRRVPLVVDRAWDLNLPTRRRLRIRPLVVDATGALISVEISGLVQSELRIKRGQLVVIGAEKFRGGKLVIALQTEK